MVEAALAVLHRSGRLEFETESDRDLVHSMLRVALVPAEPLCSEPTDAEPPR